MNIVEDAKSIAAHRRSIHKAGIFLRRVRRPVISIANDDRTASGADQLSIWSYSHLWSIRSFVELRHQTKAANCSA